MACWAWAAWSCCSGRASSQFLISMRVDSRFSMRGSVEGHCWHGPFGKRQQTGDVSFLIWPPPLRSSSWFTHSCAEWGLSPDATSLSAPWSPLACYEECEQVLFASTYSRGEILGAVEMATVTSAPVQNKVHVLFHCYLFVCSLRKKYLFLFFPFCESFYVEALFFCMPRLVILSSITFLNSTTQLPFHLRR